MLILHRANNPSLKKFKDCFSNKVGFEIDVRDFDGELIIAHDPVVDSRDHTTLKEFFEIYNQHKCNNVIAINIKACGLGQILKSLLIKFNIKNYFVFDMAVPDILGYIKSDIKFFTRQSEFESNPSFYEKAEGVWLDEFTDHWINEEAIMKHINNGKKVAIVSPELHSRNYKEIWQEYKKIIKDNKLNDNNLMICTDFPEEF